MIDLIAKAIFSAGLCGLACIPTAALCAPIDQHPELVGPKQHEMAREQTGHPRAQSIPSDIDFNEPVSTLQDAIVRAYWYNPELLSGRARKRAVDFRLPQARALYGPRIDYQLDYSYRRDRVELQPDQFRTASGWTSSISAIIEQPLLTFGRLAANEQQAQAEIGFERATLEYTEQQTIFSAIEAYVAVLRDRNAVQIARENLDLLTTTLRESEQRLNARETTIVDFRQVETRRGLAAAELETATGRLETSESRFFAVIGSPPAAELLPPTSLGQPIPNLDSALRVGLSQNPLVEAANYREQISRAAAKAAAADQKPRVDLRGRADLAPVSAYDDQLRQTAYLGQVVLSGPLFTSGLLSARRQEAEAINDADWRLIDAARRNLIEELTSAWAVRETSSQSYQSYIAAVNAAREAYAGAGTQQKAGFRTTLDVLILARDLLLVENGLNSAKYENYIANARILLALGMLNLSDVLNGEQAYDQEAHLEKVDGHGSVFPITPVVRLLDGGRNSPPEPRGVRDPALRSGELPDQMGSDLSN